MEVELDGANISITNQSFITTTFLAGNVEIHAELHPETQKAHIVRLSKDRVVWHCGLLLTSPIVPTIKPKGHTAQ